uniref:Uncharacterized protein n=1 Tax=Anopheles farauti TaxID=69004 RepID=A0A182Q949_9DIPT
MPTHPSYRSGPSDRIFWPDLRPDATDKYKYSPGGGGGRQNDGQEMEVSGNGNRPVPKPTGIQTACKNRANRSETITNPLKAANTSCKVAAAAVASGYAGGGGGGGGGGGVCGGTVIGHGKSAGADGRENASTIRLKAGKPRQGSVDDGCKIMIDIKSSPDYLNRSSGGSFDSSYKSSWGSHSSSQSQGSNDNARCRGGREGPPGATPTTGDPNPDLKGSTMVLQITPRGVFP